MRGVKGCRNGTAAGGSGGKKDDAAATKGDGRNGEVETAVSFHASPNTMIVPSKPDDQKVSPIPDIIVQGRNLAQDEFLVVACDGMGRPDQSEVRQDDIRNVRRGRIRPRTDLRGGVGHMPPPGQQG